MRVVAEWFLRGLGVALAAVLAVELLLLANLLPWLRYTVELSVLIHK